MALDLFTLQGTVAVNTRDAERGLKTVDTRARDASGKFVALDKDTRKLSGGMGHAGQSSQRFAGNLSTVTRQARESHTAVGMLSKGLSGLSTVATGALSVATGGLLTSALSGATSAVTGQIGKGVQFIKTMERGRVALTAITRDGTLAGRTLEKLGHYADEAGLDLDDAVTGAQRLLGFGYTIDELIPKMRDMGDLAASTGDAKKFANISTALGQMRSATTAQLEEFNQMRDAGVNALGLLSEATGKTTSELREMITAQQVSGRAAADLILEAARRRYSGLAQTLASETLEGREARLGNLSARRTGEAITPAVGRYSDAVAGAGDILAGEQAARFSKTIAGAADVFLSTIENGVKALATGDLSALATQAVKGAADGARAGASALYDAGAGVAGQLEQGWRDRLDQHSPSKVLTDLGFQAGASLVFGFVQGMKGQGVRAEIEKFIAEAAERFKVDPDLIRAVIQQESGFRPNALSPMGAKGLMQLMPGTAARFGVTNAYDPHQNVMGGVQYLSELIKEFKDLRLALAAYNAGEGAVRAHLPDRPDVNSYVGGSGRRWTVSEETARRTQGIPNNGQTPDYVRNIWSDYMRRLAGVTTARLSGGQVSPGPVPVQVVNPPDFSKFPGTPYAPEMEKRAGGSDAPASGDLRGGTGRFAGDPGNQRAFLEWLYSMESAAAASERTSVAAQSEYSHRVALMRQEMQVSENFVQLAQAHVSRILDAQKALQTASGGGSSSPDAFPVIKSSFNPSDYLTASTAVSTLTADLKGATAAHFDFLSSLSRTGDVAREQLGAFTAEQQKANAALLAGVNGAGKLGEQLDGLADGISDALGSGFDDGWEGAREGFKDLLLDLTREALRSELRGALRSLFNVKDEGGKDEGGGAALNPISLLLGKLFNQGGSSGGAKDNTSSAVRDAGVQAVSAVKGAGEAQAGAIETTGDATTRGLSGVSSTLLSGLAGIANQIAIGQGAGSFWKGLGMAALGGFVSGLTGGLGSKLAPGSGSSGGGGGIFSSAGGAGGPFTSPGVNPTPGGGKMASGGPVHGPGTSTSDSVQAWLSSGEFVLRASAVKSIGLNALEYMNAAGRLPPVVHRAGGGLASASYTPPTVAPVPVAAFAAPSVRASGDARRSSDGRPVVIQNNVEVKLKPDAQGRIRSQSQVMVETWQSASNEAQRNG